MQPRRARIDDDQGRAGIVVGGGGHPSMLARRAGQPSTFRRSRVDSAPPTGPPRSDGIDNSRAPHARLLESSPASTTSVGPPSPSPRSDLSCSVRACGLRSPRRRSPSATCWQEGTPLRTPPPGRTSVHHHGPGVGPSSSRSPRPSPVSAEEPTADPTPVVAPTADADPVVDPTPAPIDTTRPRTSPTVVAPAVVTEAADDRGAADHPHREARSSATRGATALAGRAPSTAPGSSSTPSSRPATRGPSAVAIWPRRGPSIAGTRPAAWPAGTDPKVGDLVIWGGGTHVGIYVGNGKAISTLTQRRPDPPGPRGDGAVHRLPPHRHVEEGLELAVDGRQHPQDRGRRPVDVVLGRPPAGDRDAHRGTTLPRPSRRASTYRRAGRRR